MLGPVASPAREDLVEISVAALRGRGMVGSHGAFPTTCAVMERREEARRVCGIALRIERSFQTVESRRMLKQIDLKASNVDRRDAIRPLRPRCCHRLGQAGIERPSAIRVDRPRPRGNALRDGITATALDQTHREQQPGRQVLLTLRRPSGDLACSVGAVVGGERRKDNRGCCDQAGGYNPAPSEPPSLLQHDVADQHDVAEVGKYATAVSVSPLKGAGSNVPPQYEQVMVTSMKEVWEIQTTAGAGVTPDADMIPGKIQLPAVVTAYCGALVQLGEPIAAQRATSEAVDCSAPFAHTSNPTSSTARHSGTKTAATMANSMAAAPPRPNPVPLAAVTAAVWWRFRSRSH